MVLRCATVYVQNVYMLYVDECVHDALFDAVPNL